MACLSILYSVHMNNMLRLISPKCSLPHWRYSGISHVHINSNNIHDEMWNWVMWSNLQKYRVLEETWHHKGLKVQGICANPVYYDLNSPINLLVFTEASTSMSDDPSMPFDDHEWFWWGRHWTCEHLIYISSLNNTFHIKKFTDILATITISHLPCLWRFILPLYNLEHISPTLIFKHFWNLPLHSLRHFLLNPLTTNDGYTRQARQRA